MAKQPGLLRRFFGGLWQILTISRTIVLNMLFLFLVLLILDAMMSSPVNVVPENAALVLSPKGNLVEEKSYVNPLTNLIGSPTASPAARETLMRELLDAIALAAVDDSIQALVLQLDELQGGGFSKLQDLGRAIEQFRQSNKPVYAVGDMYSQAQYYIATHADEIIMNPLGGVDLTGFSNYQMFYKSALDRLRVNMHIYRVGTYKSAVEPFERDDMSAEAREANALWLGDLWSVYVEDINRNRQLEPGTVENLINNLDGELARVGGDTAQLAVEAGLVDQLLDRNAVRQRLISLLGPSRNENSFNQVGHEAYLQARQGLRAPQGTAPEVAVIVASGTIYDGQQRPGSIGGDSLVRLIREARESDSVRAVVLRIDSPGGSAFASEIIRSELISLKSSGKPLIASMGSVAASGGYWIASPADQIWASPTTITGSIGIFGILPTFEDSLDAIGVHTDGVGTTDIAGAFTLGNELPETVSNALQLSVENGYQRFLEIVSQGRNLSTDEVDEIGQGRVWSGQRALNLGLVDEMGGLDAAVESAAALAGLDNYRLRYIEQRLSPAEQLLSELSDSLSLAPVLNGTMASAGTVSGTLAGLYRQFSAEINRLLRLNDPQGLYLHCLECRLF